MNQENYKFDVAFSFLAQDEPLATELNDLLQDRLKTFLYSKKQEEIAAKDGEEIFGKVFSEQARMVVILYRIGWGKTPWTRIEETAIRNRAYDQGYDFTIFIPLDDIPSIPKWVPKNRLWVDIKRWGSNGAASVIENRIQERGGEPREETVNERAARLNRSLVFEVQRRKFRNSFEGVRAANEEFYKLKERITELVNEINQGESGIKLQIFDTTNNKIMIFGLVLWLTVEWKCKYNNCLENSELNIAIWDGNPTQPDIVRGMPLKKLDEAKINFDMLRTGEFRWVIISSGRSFSTKDLNEYIIKYLLNKIQTLL